MAKVLVVDDDAAALEIRRLTLERAGHQVLVAASADQARAAPRPDVAILDLRLPNVEDGLALIRDLHALGIQIIVLCGNRSDLDRRDEARLVHRILSKPVRSEILLNSLPL